MRFVVVSDTITVIFDIIAFAYVVVDVVDGLGAVNHLLIRHHRHHRHARVYILPGHLINPVHVV